MLAKTPKTRRFSAVFLKKEFLKWDTIKILIKKFVLEHFTLDRQFFFVRITRTNEMILTAIFTQLRL